MLHAPWHSGVRSFGAEKLPFPVPGHTIAETTGAFADTGGKLEALASVLEPLLPPGYSTIDPLQLISSKTSYSLEFYLYVVLFTKDLLLDPLFRYRPSDGVEPDEHHFMFEQGPLVYRPWLSVADDKQSVYFSMANIAALVEYVEKAAPIPPFGEGDAAAIGQRMLDDALAIINAWSPKEFQADRSLFMRDEVMISCEYMFYIMNVMECLHNDGKFPFNSLRYGFTQSRALARAVFLQPDISPAQGLREWQMRTDNIYNMEFEERSRTVTISYNFSRLRQSGAFGDYAASTIKGLKQGVAGANSAFVELASGQPVKYKILKPIDARREHRVRYKWRSSPNIQRLMMAAGSSGIVVLALLLFGMSRFPSAWYIPVTIGFSFMLITGFTGLAVYWRGRLKTMYSRFADAQKVINTQLDSLGNRTAELLKERDGLEEKVKERTAELQEALEQVQRLDSAKTNFLANVSHELRTPLTLITVPFEEILNGRWGTSLPHNHESFGLIKRNVDRIRLQVSRLLDFTRLDLGTAHFNPKYVDVLPYCRVMVEELHALAAKRGLSLGLENRGDREHYLIQADTSLLETVLLNLLYNAIKFTNEGCIDIIFDVVDGSLRLGIRDTGIGIASEKQEEIFSRFTQLNKGQSRTYEGAGLGLALVREIADLHGWITSVKSRPGEGSTFSLLMPLLSGDVQGSTLRPESGPQQLVQAEIPPVADPIPAVMVKGRDLILIVEDNPDMGRILQELMEDDFNVVWCRSGFEAIERLAMNSDVSLILCDVMMPGMSGFELLEELAKTSATSEIPFMFLTALDTPEDRFNGLRSGAVDYLAKPFNRDELLAKVRNLIQTCKASYSLALRDMEGYSRLNRMNTTEEKRDTEKAWDDYGITMAERRVVELLREGLQNKEIAECLSISPRTVSTHLSHTYAKTGTQNRIELLKILE